MCLTLLVFIQKKINKGQYCTFYCTFRLIQTFMVKCSFNWCFLTRIQTYIHESAAQSTCHAKHNKLPNMQGSLGTVDPEESSSRWLLSLTFMLSREQSEWITESSRTAESPFISSLHQTSPSASTGKLSFASFSKKGRMEHIFLCSWSC